MAQLEFECTQHEGGMASLQGNYCAIPASLLGLLPSFHLELSFSNSDRRREKDSYSVSSIWTQGSRSSLASQLILSVLGTCGSGEMSCLERPSSVASEACTQKVSTQRCGSHLYFINIIIIFL